MTIDEVISGLENKAFCSSAAQYKHDEYTTCKAPIIFDLRIVNEGKILVLDPNHKRQIGSGAEHILHELNVVNNLQNRVTKANKNKLGTFELCLVMEEQEA